MTQRATEAAKEYWDENRDEVIAGASNAARNYWAENKGEILESAREDISKVGETVVATAKSYVDDKLAEQRERAVAKLVAEGYKRSDIDSNGDGVITDQELSDFVASNPFAMFAGGGALVLWFGLSRLNRKVNAKPPSQ